MNLRNLLTRVKKRIKPKGAGAFSAIKAAELIKERKRKSTTAMEELFPRPVKKRRKAIALPRKSR